VSVAACAGSSLSVDPAIGRFFQLPCDPQHGLAGKPKRSLAQRVHSPSRFASHGLGLDRASGEPRCLGNLHRIGRFPTYGK
jgi:hypothetical protein